MANANAKTVQQLSDGGPEGSTFGSASGKISLYGKTPLAQQTAPTIVESVNPSVSGSAFVASIQSIAVYAASRVNEVILALSKVGVYL